MKQKRLDCMVDLECLSGNSHNPVILQIAAVMFDLRTGKTFEEFNMFINPKSCIEYGLEINGETVAWWLNQDKDAINQILIKSIQEGHKLSDVLDQFTDWYKNCLKNHNMNYATLFGNGPSADCVWIDSLYKATDKENPFKYFNDRCVRTFVDLGRDLLNYDPKKTMKFNGVKHDGIDDAKHQIKYVSAIYKKLKKSLK